MAATGGPALAGDGPRLDGPATTTASSLPRVVTEASSRPRRRWIRSSLSRPPPDPLFLTTVPLSSSGTPCPTPASSRRPTPRSADADDVPYLLMWATTLA